MPSIGYGTGTVTPVGNTWTEHGARRSRIKRIIESPQNPVERAKAEEYKQEAKAGKITQGSIIVKQKQAETQPPLSPTEQAQRESLISQGKSQEAFKIYGTRPYYASQTVSLKEAPTPIGKSNVTTYSVIQEIKPTVVIIPEPGIGGKVLSGIKSGLAFGEWLVFTPVTFTKNALTQTVGKPALGSAIAFSTNYTARGPIVASKEALKTYASPKKQEAYINAVEVSTKAALIATGPQAVIKPVMLGWAAQEGSIAKSQTNYPITTKIKGTTYKFSRGRNILSGIAATAYIVPSLIPTKTVTTKARTTGVATEIPELRTNTRTFFKAKTIATIKTTTTRKWWFGPSITTSKFSKIKFNYPLVEARKITPTETHTFMEGTAITKGKTLTTSVFGKITNKITVPIEGMAVTYSSKNIGRAFYSGRLGTQYKAGVQAFKTIEVVKTPDYTFYETRISGVRTEGLQYTKIFKTMPSTPQMTFTSKGPSVTTTKAITQQAVIAPLPSSGFLSTTTSKTSITALGLPISSPKQRITPKVSATSKIERIKPGTISPSSVIPPSEITRTGSRAVIASFEGIAAKTMPKTSTLPRIGTITPSKATVVPKTSPITSEIQLPRTDLRTLVGSVGRTALRLTPSGGQGFGILYPEFGGQFQYDFDFRIPDLSFNLEGLKVGGVKGFQPTGYVPSFGALIFKRLGSYMPSGLSKTGFEFRPITGSFLKGLGRRFRLLR